jgi:hypothetical protein
VRKETYSVMYSMPRNCGSRYVCSQFFSETDLTLAEATSVETAVPGHCTAVSQLQSAQRCEEPCLNSSSCEDFHALVPTKTYSMSP